MAEIRKIVRSNPLSTFQNVAPSSGGAFDLLALAAETAYSRLEPAAIEEQKAAGAQFGRDIARSQMGDPQGAFTQSTMGGGGNFREALGQAESGGDYGIVNSEGFTGKYQWGQARLDDFNRANGTSYSLEEFRTNSTVQEQAQDWHERDILSELGGYVGTEVNGQVLDGPAIIAMAHLGGKGGARRYIETGGAYNPADSNGTRLSDYAGRFGGGNVSMSSSGGPAVMLREADGKLTARLYSPLSGPILQAHNAAAGVAYLSEVTVKGTADLMGLSEQFLLNPEGFAQAAKGYVDDMVSNAPEAFRNDLRAELEGEVQRRMLGMVEERHRETRQRAANSNQALIEKWSDDLAAASVAGDLDAISAAEAKLGAALRARESLPGLAWTPEESANVVRKAREEGARRVADMRKQQEDVFKADLNTIIDAAKAGRNAAAESILDNPLAAAAHPELFREATAFVTLRDQMPSFLKLTPEEQKAAIAEFKAQPVKEAWEIDLFDAAEKSYQANAKAWEEDPIKRAGEVLTNKPPALPQFDPNNPQAFIDGLAGRAEYGRNLQAQGYIDYKAFLTNEEAQTIGGLMGKDVPPEIKAALAGAIVSGFGDDAAKVFQEIKSDDPVTKMAGMLMARGGDPNVAVQAMRGQAMLDEGLVSAPAKASTVGAVSPDIAAALSFTPIEAQGDLLKMATAIYATLAEPNADEARQKELMGEAMQVALGRSTNKRGQATGGVQEIGSNPVLLPPGVAGEAVQSALDKAFGNTGGVWDYITQNPLEGLASMTGYDAPVTDQAAIWDKIGGTPMMGGAPIDPSLFRKGYVRLVPMGGTSYRMEVMAGESVLIPRNAQGAPYTFDVNALLEAAK